MQPTHPPPEREHDGPRRRPTQSAGFLFDQLDRAGYVERVPEPSDARARLVQIAERGRQTLPIAASVVSEVEAEWTKHLGKRRIGQLR